MTDDPNARPRIHYSVDQCRALRREGRRFIKALTNWPIKQGKRILTTPLGWWVIVNGYAVQLEGSSIVAEFRSPEERDAFLAAINSDQGATP